MASWLTSHANFEMKKILKQAQGQDYNSLPVPTPETVSLLEQAKEIAQAELQSCTFAAVMEAVTTMMVQYPNHGIGAGARTAQEAEQAVVAYVKTAEVILAGIPKWALNAALVKAMVASPQFMPNAAAIRQHAKDIHRLRVARETLFDINRILERAR